MKLSTAIYGFLVFFSIVVAMLSGCFTTSAISMQNGTGNDIRIVIFINDRFINKHGKFQSTGIDSSMTIFLEVGEVVEFENRVYMDVYDDIPFDSIQIQQADRSDFALTREQIYPGYMDTDVLGLIANPYRILISSY